jgi:hypothetical protein
MTNKYSTARKEIKKMKDQSQPRIELRPSLQVKLK